MNKAAQLKLEERDKNSMFGISYMDWPEQPGKEPPSTYHMKNEDTYPDILIAQRSHMFNK